MEHLSERLDVQESRIAEEYKDKFEFIKHLDPKFTYLKKEK